MTTMPPVNEPTGPVPEDNQPGHHPPIEQDKPTRAPKLPERYRHLPFRRDSWLALSSLPFGVIDRNAYVDVNDERLQIRFGPFVVETPMANVEGVERTGPYKWWKVAGP